MPLGLKCAFLNPNYRYGGSKFEKKIVSSKNNPQWRYSPCLTSANLFQWHMNNSSCKDARNYKNFIVALK